MFSQISWAAYIEAAVYAVGIYYAYVLYKYYRHDLAHIVNGRQKATVAKASANSPALQSTSTKDNPTSLADFMPKESRHDEYSLSTESLINEIDAFTVEAGNNKFEREPLLLSIRLLISKYPSIKLSPYKESIQKLVAQQCTTNCSVHLSDEELDGLWV